MTFLSHKFFWDQVATKTADKNNMVQAKWQDSFSQVLVSYFHPKREGHNNITCCGPSLCEAWEKVLLIGLLTHALGANFCSNALLISAHFLINGGVITRLGLMGQTHWRLPPLCQISPAVISFTFPGRWLQTEGSTHRDRDEAKVTVKGVLFPWLCQKTTFRHTEVFQVMLFIYPRNPLLFCYIAK